MTKRHDGPEVGYRGIFPERAGESSRNLTEILVGPPDHELSEVELQEVRRFENELFDWPVRSGRTLESVVRSHKAEDVTAPLVFPGAFLETPIVTEDKMYEVSFEDQQEVYAWFATTASGDDADKSHLLALAKESGEWYRAKLANALSTGTASDDLEEMMPIVLDPKAAMDNFRDVQELRSHLHILRTIYSEDQGKVEGAKRAVVDVYLARINALCAGDMTRMDYLTKQAKLSGDDELVTRVRSLLSPTFQKAFEQDETRSGVLRRFDYLQDGMGIDAKGHASAVSKRLYEIASETERVNGPENGIFSAEETEQIKSYTLNPDQMREIFTAVLSRAGMLSSEESSTWSPTRTHRARDGKFQVVENPGKSTFAVDSHSGVFKYSSKPRSLFDVIVVGGVHELTHINQAEADRQLGETLRIAELKGKRCGMLREGGANANQRSAERALFGESKPIALTYAKAYEALHETGSVVEAGRAFMKEKLSAFPKLSPEKAAEEAADRVLRLKRAGGFSSGALVYAEEAILNHELKDSPVPLRSRATAVTSLDLVDQVRLHRYGLLPVVTTASVDWMPHILEAVRPYVDEALSRSDWYKES